MTIHRDPMPSAANQPGALVPESVGFVEVIFQSLTYISPGTSLALVLPFVVAYAAGALPLVVMLIFVGCFATAWLLGEMASKLPSSGGMLTYISNALGSNVGFIAGWMYLLCLLADVAGIFLLLAFFIADQMESSFGLNTTLTWVLVTVLLAGFVTLNGLRRASRGTRLGAILGTIEVAAFALLSLFLIVKAGSHNTLWVFTTHYATAAGYHGMSGVIAASVLTILAYQGFESAVILGEEAKRPRVSIKTGMLLAVTAILVYFVLATYASTVFFGPNRMVEFSSYGHGVPWDQLARDAWGAGWVIIFLAIVNSVTACGNAANITTTRTVFAMARAGALPRRLASTNHAGVPGPAQIATTVVALGAAVGSAIVWGPTSAAYFLLTITSGIIIALYIVAAAACVALYARQFRDEFSIVRHVLPMLVVLVGFVPAFLATFGIRVFRFVSPLAWPDSLVAPVCIGWLLLGAAVGLYLARGREGGLAGMRQVYVGGTCSVGKGGVTEDPRGLASANSVD